MTANFCHISFAFLIQRMTFLCLRILYKTLFFALHLFISCRFDDDEIDAARDATDLDPVIDSRHHLRYSTGVITF